MIGDSEAFSGSKLPVRRSLHQVLHAFSIRPLLPKSGHMPYTKCIVFGLRVSSHFQGILFNTFVLYKLTYCARIGKITVYFVSAVNRVRIIGSIQYRYGCLPCDSEPKGCAKDREKTTGREHNRQAIHY